MVVASCLHGLDSRVWHDQGAGSSGFEGALDRLEGGQAEQERRQDLERGSDQGKTDEGRSGSESRVRHGVPTV